ncbi:MAG: tRNA (guanosine(37)-N1)-methyltransferase TrmD [Desulfobacterota bacterium]|nr:tRNA (guanosine(37)-N1)-methyltransferase TrmD [Thermodesulfobacteriota bacterium]MDW8001839.1 tRNA (guanosine(37)-N1)-methyltransferase TrmD [Deltaproteobacteria bacterium]
MLISVLTLFPRIFESPLNESIIRKAKEKRLVSFNIINIRDFATDPHRTCDDYPYGGGPGMVMKIEPLYRAIEYVKTNFGEARFILLTPQGRLLTWEVCEKLASLDHICLICGRYEGVDERILEFVDDEISIGDYILSGGEPAAIVVIDAVVRLLPKVLGNEDSKVTESFREYLLEHPQYTRPENFMGLRVPPVLLSGNHEEIRKWRRKESIRKTILRRPDLMERFVPTEEDRKFIKEIMEEIPF